MAPRAAITVADSAGRSSRARPASRLAASIERLGIADFESAPVHLAVRVSVAVVAVISNVRIPIVDITRVRELAIVPHVVLSTSQPLAVSNLVRAPLVLRVVARCLVD